MDTSPIDLQTLLSERARYQRGILADRTLRGYAYDLGHFRAWCTTMDRASMPASGDTTSLYLTGMLVTGKKVTTTSRHASAIAHAHRQDGLESPVTRDIRQLLRNAKRIRCEPVHQMRAITVEELRQMVGTLALDGSPNAIRNSSMLTLGFFSALRRSNIAGLELGDVEFTSEGMILRIRHEKQDREGIPRLIGIPYGTSEETCPVKGLRVWLAYRGTSEGAALYTHTEPGAHRRGLLPESYCRIVKQSMTLAGLDCTDYGAHSMRAAFVTAAFDAGADTMVVAAHTGHHDLRVLRDYYRRIRLFKSNACDKIAV